MQQPDDELEAVRDAVRTAGEILSPADLAAIERRRSEIFTAARAKGVDPEGDAYVVGAMQAAAQCAMLLAQFGIPQDVLGKLSLIFWATVIAPDPVAGADLPPIEPPAHVGALEQALFEISTPIQDRELSQDVDDLAEFVEARARDRQLDLDDPIAQATWQIAGETVAEIFRRRELVARELGSSAYTIEATAWRAGLIWRLGLLPLRPYKPGGEDR